MTTISCNSCGMQYDGSGLQAGVQFQCTNCGAMVQVSGGGAAPRRAAPGKRPAGGPRAGGAPAGRRGPGAGGPGARKPLGNRAPVGPAGGGERQPFAPPPKKGNGGMIAGIIIGVAAIGLIIVIAVMASGPSPQDLAQQKKDEEFQKRKDAQKKKDAETKAANDRMNRVFEATYLMGADLASAINSKNADTISGMFDWNMYAAYREDYVKAKVAGGADRGDYLVDPLWADGEWEKNDEGNYTGVYLGKSLHGPSGLKTNVMKYIEFASFGVPATFLREKTEGEKAAFALDFKGKKIFGRKIYIEIGVGKKTSEFEFMAGAEEGTENVRLFGFSHKGSNKLFQKMEGVERAKPKPVDDRDPTNPDRNPDNGRDPDSGKTPLEGGGEEGGTDTTTEEDLPEMKKTGAVVEDRSAIGNIMRDVVKGNKLTNAQETAVKGAEKSIRKQFMGQVIDLLIKAYNDGDRSNKQHYSEVLWSIWSNFATSGEEDYVYAIGGFGGGDNTSDKPIRRWLKIYNNYKTD